MPNENDMFFCGSWNPLSANVPREVVAAVTLLTAGGLAGLVSMTETHTYPLHSSTSTSVTEAGSQGAHVGLTAAFVLSLGTVCIGAIYLTAVAYYKGEKKTQTGVNEISPLLEANSSVVAQRPSVFSRFFGCLRKASGPEVVHDAENDQNDQLDRALSNNL